MSSFAGAEKFPLKASAILRLAARKAASAHNHSSTAFTFAQPLFFALVGNRRKSAEALPGLVNVRSAHKGNCTRHGGKTQ